MTNIVVGVDGSVHAERALRWALEEAAFRDDSVRAVLAWAAAGPPRTPSEQPPATSPDHSRWIAQQLLEEVVERAREADPRVGIVQRTVFGPPVTALLDESVDARMLVIGSRGMTGGSRMLAGSVSIACAHAAELPVVVVRGTTGSRTDPRPVIVGVDGSAASIAALRWAADETRLRNVPLQVIHVWSAVSPGYVGYRLAVDEAGLEGAAQSVMRECLDARTTADDVDVEARVIRGGTARSLLDAAVSAQMLVVGARGRGGFDGLQLGGISHQCVLYSPCPTAVIRTPPGDGG